MGGGVWWKGVGYSDGSCGRSKEIEVDSDRWWVV